MKGIVPEEIRLRKDKMGWVAPIHDWLNGSLGKEIESTLSNTTQSHLSHRNRSIEDTLEKVKAFKKSGKQGLRDGRKLWEEAMPFFWEKGLRSTF